MVDKVIINKKIIIKSIVSEKKDVSDRINEKELTNDTKDDIQVEAGNGRKLAPKLFI